MKGEEGQAVARQMRAGEQEAKQKVEASITAKDMNDFATTVAQATAQAVLDLIPR